MNQLQSSTTAPVFGVNHHEGLAPACNFTVPRRLLPASAPQTPLPGCAITYTVVFLNYEVTIRGVFQVLRLVFISHNVYFLRRPKHYLSLAVASRAFSSNTLLDVISRTQKSDMASFCSSHLQVHAYPFSLAQHVELFGRHSPMVTLVYSTKKT